MRSACQALEVDMDNIIKDANKVSKKLPEIENIEVLDNLKGSENKSLLPQIIAGAALGFLIFRLLGK
jgi:hypothetical protein